MTSTTAAAADYAARRAEQLLSLLEDVESWAVLHRHALDQARAHPRGSQAHDVLERLADACRGIVALAEQAEEGAGDPLLDEVAVDQAVAGCRRGPLTIAERRAVIDRLDVLGHSAAVIAERAGCTERTVVRRRKQRELDDRKED